MTRLSSTKPVRLQRKRTKGYRMPPNTVSVTRPGKWGNPWKVGQRIGSSGGEPVYATAQTCVDLFRLHFFDVDSTFPQQDLNELRGKNLACYCALDQPCHADVLLEIANR